MDPFAEKDMIDCLKSIASSLRNIDRKIDELTIAVREASIGLDPNAEDIEDEEAEEDFNTSGNNLS
jgi:hypothetical protein